MIGPTGSRPSTARRRRLSGARRIKPAPRFFARRGLSRAGFHGLMTAIGLAAAVTVWSAPRGALDADRDVASLAGDSVDAATAPLAFVEASHADVGARAGAARTGDAVKPHVRTVLQGDTLRSIANEYSVSISTVLASNRLDDPNMLRLGQDILIPPIEGVIADVRPNETLAQLAERYGVDIADIAEANALAVDPEAAIPYERIVVPGMETAERAVAGSARRQDGADTLALRDDGELAFSTKPTGVSYEVQDGDTVGQLATQFGVSVWTILTANNLSDGDMIKPGMQLKVLPVNGVEHEIQPGESLSDIAQFYKVDLGPLVDFNAIGDPDSLTVGSTLTIPGAERMQPGFSLAQTSGPSSTVVIGPARAPAPAPVAGVAAAQRPALLSAVAQAKPQGGSTQAGARPVASQSAGTQAAAKLSGATAQAKPSGATAPGTTRLQAASVSASAGGGVSSAGIVGNAMKFLGSRYVFGGTSPSGFDCSGFVWYVHNAAGRPISRGLWGQMNGGPRIATSALQAGDTVFFANTYMPGLSHVGIYIGGGRFIHASDESSGVKVSSLSDSYWGPRFVGASRLW